MNRNSVCILVSAALLLSLGSCGGSGDGVTITPPPLPAPPATESISAIGVVTALDSVTINGIVYQTDSTTVTRNGQAGNFTDLEIGQIVALEGTVEVGARRGTADQVDYEATLIGPVENIDATLGRLVVMGQSVRTDADTQFDPSIDPSTFAGLTVGSAAQISGFRDANAQILATRIEPDLTAAGEQIIGGIASLDLANSVFSMGGLAVDYSSASLIDVPGGMPANGLFVVVRGSLAGGILVADSVEALYDTAGAVPGERAQAQGVITRFASATDFDVNGFPITTNASTTFSGGSVDDLRSNAEVTVDGEVAASGDAVLAEEITFGRVVAATTTLTFNFSNFTDINVRDVFNVTVRQDSEFLVQVTIDEEDASRVDVTQASGALNIGLLPSTGDVDIQTLEAVVTLPVLNVIDLDGVINVTLRDFDQFRLIAIVQGVSRLFSDSIMIGDLTANITGVSQLDFGNVRPMATVSINVSGVSTATVNMDTGSLLSGSVTGVSSLNYYGTGVSVNVTVGLDSSLNKLGETRP